MAMVDSRRKNSSDVKDQKVREQLRNVDVLPLATLGDLVWEDGGGVQW